MVSSAWKHHIWILGPSRSFPRKNQSIINYSCSSKNKIPNFLIAYTVGGVRGVLITEADPGDWGVGLGFRGLRDLKDLGGSGGLGLGYTV